MPPKGPQQYVGVSGSLCPKDNLSDSFPSKVVAVVAFITADQIKSFQGSQGLYEDNASGLIHAQVKWLSNVWKDQGWGRHPDLFQGFEGPLLSLSPFLRLGTTPVLT